MAASKRYHGGMADDEIKTTVRLERGLHERLVAAAGRDRRSMHSQIITYIERGVAADERRDRRMATMARKQQETG
jgi:predicted HicB family RNase H-like nuclease